MVGADFARTNELLAGAEGEGDVLAHRARLAASPGLMIAPAGRRLLGRGRDDLAPLTVAHCGPRRAKVIGPGLRDAALAQRLKFATSIANPRARRSPPTRVRRSCARVSPACRVSLYDLDRLDVDVSATLDQRLQQAVGEHLGRARRPDFARETGIIGAGC